jgi:hypothetical protein
MDHRQTPKQDVVALMALRTRRKHEKTMRLAIVRYRHLKSQSENTTDFFEKAKLYEMALTCLANSAEQD